MGGGAIGESFDGRNCRKSDRLSRQGLPSVASRAKPAPEVGKSFRFHHALADSRRRIPKAAWHLLPGRRRPAGRALNLL